MPGSESETTRDARRGPRLLPFLGRLLRRERLLQVAAGLAVVVVLVSWVPILPFEARRVFATLVAPFLFALLVPLSFSAAFSGRPSRAAWTGESEAGFWRDLRIGVWAAAVAVVLRVPGFAFDWVVLSLLAHACLTAGYTAVVMAVERQPHRQRSDALAERRLTLPTILVLVVGLLVYFVLLPLLAQGDGADPDGPMAQIYTALALYLGLRLVYLRFLAPRGRWRILYTLLALLVVCALFFHAVRVPRIGQLGSELVEGLAPSAWLFWLPPLFLLLVLGRARAYPFPRRAGEVSGASARLAGEPPSLALRTMFLAVLVPVVHVGAYLAGFFDPALEVARERWIFFWVVALGAIAFFQNRRLSAELGKSFRERRRIENALANTERSLRLAEERRRSDEAIWYSREKYVKAFRYSPYAMVITSLDEGRHLECNQRYVEFLGWEREEVTGKTTDELGVWADPRDREAFVADLRRDGGFRDREIRFRTKTGQERLAKISSEVMEIDGRDCAFTVARDVTAQEEHIADLRHQAALLESCRDAVIVVDAEDRVSYWNLAAEEILGWSDDNVHGRPAAEILSPAEPSLVGEAVRGVLLDGTWRGRLRGLDAGGREVDLETLWCLVDDTRGAPTAKLVLARHAREV